jgi:pantoate--beta-alanine ligase
VIKTIGTCDEIRDLVLKMRGQGETVGLVPTMGALHEGHLSLVRESIASCDHTVISIFVNPTQFGPSEDLAKYPRTLDSDLAMLNEVAKDYAKTFPIVFAPNEVEMYPEGYSTSVDPPAVAAPLEGVFRPGHFRGVTTVVLKLFAAVPANTAYFGLKDYQQFRVIQAMTQDLNLGLRIHACPTVRESDGLAMSSRNRYLSPEDRVRALSLSQALSAAQKLLDQGIRCPIEIMDCIRQTLSVVDQVDYAAIVDSDTLQPVEEISSEAVALIAARVGGTRLIDNRVLRVK